MANIQDTKFSPEGLAMVLKGEALSVPLNQREYSWEDEHVDDLFTDLADAIAENSSSYFLGTIVLNVSKNPPEIVDGQQRLATTTILLAAMRDYLVGVDNNFANSLDAKYLIEYDALQSTHVPRLTLNFDDKDYFRDKVLLRAVDDVRRTLPDPTSASHKRIRDAAAKAAERVQQIVAGQKNPVHRINAWVDFLERRAIAIALRVPDEMNAFGMFETLNDRGLRTTQADMLKSYLFQQISNNGKSGLTDSQILWSSMRAVLESVNDDAGILLSYFRHVTLATYGPIGKGGAGQFYAHIQSNVKGQANSQAFLRTLCRLAEDYAAILSPSHKKWKDYPSATRDAISTMLEFNVSQIRPLMLAVAAYFPPQEAAKAFRAFVCWTVRFLICGGMRGQKLEDAYADCAHGIFNKDVKTFSQLKKRMESHDVLWNDATFSDEFSKATVSKSYLARYYLRAMEATKRQESDEPELEPVRDTAVLNLEHILPVTPGGKWGHVQPEVADALCKRIGNMVLLHAEKNKVAGNAEFSDKYPVLKASALKLTSEVCDHTTQSDEWGRDQIDKRQMRLAALAVKTWPL